MIKKLLETEFVSQRIPSTPKVNHYFVNELWHEYSTTTACLHLGPSLDPHLQWSEKEAPNGEYKCANFSRTCLICEERHVHH